MVRSARQFVAGLVCGAGATAVLMSGVALRAGEVQGETSSKVVFENERVRVKDVTFPAGGGDKQVHTHQLPHVGVILTPGALTFTEPGKKTETVKFDAGSVGFREANVTHSATNPGKEAMRVIEVELK